MDNAIKSWPRTLAVAALAASAAVAASAQLAAAFQPALAAPANPPTPPYVEQQYEGDLQPLPPIETAPGALPAPTNESASSYGNTSPYEGAPPSASATELPPTQLASNQPFNQSTQPQVYQHLGLAEVAADVPFSERNFREDVLTLPVEPLLGDLGGLRPALKDDGITPSLTFVTDLFGNPVGGRSQGFTEADNLGLNATFDMEKRRGIEGGTFFVSLSQRSGNSLSDEHVGNFFDIQQVFGGPTFHVVDLAWRQKLLDDDVELRAGRLGASDDFLVSPYNFGFVQNGFCGCPVGIFVNAPGMSGYPNATWGALLKARSSERTYVMGGVYNGDASIRDLDNHGCDFSMNGPLFAIAEAGLRRNQLPGDEGLVGNYKVGAWFDGNNFNNLSAQAIASVSPGFPVPVHDGNYGFYVLCDQVLVRFGNPGDEILRGLGVVGSFLVSSDQSISQMPYFFNVGLALRGLAASRPRDTLGFGLVFGEFSQDLRDGQRQAQLIDPTVGVQSHEIALEWTYIARFREGGYFIQPDLQYILRPNGTGQIPDAVAVGTQVGVNF